MSALISFESSCFNETSDIIKLTALFAAKRGRGFLSVLSAREGRNFQFEFLRPSHSLFPYFNRLVEQYTKVIHPTADSLALVSERATPKGKRELLVDIQKYAVSERMKRERAKKREDDREEETKAFAEIDWHDYAIVQTIEFTSADAGAELPVPMTRAEVESMTLAQKRMAAMIMEDAEEDIAAHNARQAAAEVEAANAEVLSTNGAVGRMGTAMQEDDEYRAIRLKAEEERERELTRARAVQASSMDASGPIKIKTDYVSKRELLSIYLDVHTLNTLQSDKRVTKQSQRAQSAGSKYPSTKSTNTCVSNSSIPNGRPNEMLSKLDVHKLPSSNAEPTSFLPFPNSPKPEWISLVMKRLKRRGGERRRRIKLRGRKGRRLFGMVIRLRKSGLWISIAPM